MRSMIFNALCSNSDITFYRDHELYKEVFICTASRKPDLNPNLLYMPTTCQAAMNISYSDFDLLPTMSILPDYSHIHMICCCLLPLGAGSLSISISMHRVSPISVAGDSLLNSCNKTFFAQEIID